MKGKKFLAVQTQLLLMCTFYSLFPLHMFPHLFLIDKMMGGGCAFVPCICHIADNSIYGNLAVCQVLSAITRYL